jgi:hypothetical protein
LDATTGKFMPDRFAEVKDKGLRGSVSRHLWNRLEAGVGGDIDDDADATGRHRPAKEICQRYECLNIHRDLRFLRLQIMGQELAAPAEPGVIHEKIDLNAAALDLVRNLLGAVWV